MGVLDKIGKMIKSGLKKPMAKNTAGKSQKKMNKANLEDRMKKELLSYERAKVKGKKGLEDKIMKLKHELRKGKEAPKSNEAMKMPKMKSGNLGSTAMRRAGITKDK